MTIFNIPINYFPNIIRSRKVMYYYAAMLTVGRAMMTKDLVPT